MERLAAVKGLLEFQRTNGDGLAPVLDYVAKETLQEFLVRRLFMTLIRPNGAIHVPFIENREEYPQGHDREIIFDEHVPCYDAVVNGKIISTGDIHEYPFYYPENVPVMFPDGFESSYIFPVPKFGALSMFCDGKHRVDGANGDFLHSIGEIISLYMSNGNHGVDLGDQNHKLDPINILPLTPRQWAIRDAMLRGLTNGAIAREMNFSESLIRHETIRIYSKLGINGRRELFAIEKEKNEKEQS